MDNRSKAVGYTCPMHRSVHQSQQGPCPTCGMSLVPEGSRFQLLRHMLGSPTLIPVMAGVMIVVMAAAMMMR
jgi:hypothetical protein